MTIFRRRNVTLLRSATACFLLSLFSTACFMLRFNHQPQRAPGGTGNLSAFHLLLPHLTERDDLTPSFDSGGTSQRRKLVIGIPSVQRQSSSYLHGTLELLLGHLRPGEAEEVCLLVMLSSFSGSDEDAWLRSSVSDIRKNFSSEMAAGQLRVIVPPSKLYPPDMEDLPPTFDIDAGEMKWRTKQNLDYAYLMSFAVDKAELYLQLEDDVEPTEGYFSAIKDFMHKKRDKDWLMLEFSPLGFIGKLMRTSELSLLVHFLLLFHRDKPCDWLLDNLFLVKYCVSGKPWDECLRRANAHRLGPEEALFLHKGHQSSLIGKTSRLKSP